VRRVADLTSFPGRLQVRHALFAAALIGAGPALGAPYTFTPLPNGFTAMALNNLGQVAGQAPGTIAPALLSGSTVIPLIPNAICSDSNVSRVGSTGCGSVCFHDDGG